MKAEATVLSIHPEKPELEKIRVAAKIIREGGLVGYPTETVYGLGADARSDEAVAKVFRAKARALEEPISVAVNSLEMAGRVAELRPVFKTLAEEFLPGPLTIIAPVKPGLSRLVTANTGKVGIRIPNHRVAFELIKLLGFPITSTSANLSGKQSPSTVKEALGQLGENIDAILDSGKCLLATPSTVVDLTLHPPRILREGPVPAEKIRRVLNL